MRRKWFLLLAVPAALLAGCGGSSHRSGSTTLPSTSVSLSLPTVPTTTTPPESSVPTTPAATSTSTSSVPGGPPACATSSLSAALGQSSGAAGKIVYQLLLRDTSGAPCTVAGYPGVSFVTGPSGQQVGAAASRVPASYSSVLLQPGAQAEATLAVEDPANYPSSCEVTPVAGLRIFPPGQTASLYVAHSDRTCANSADVTLHVNPLSIVSG